ncbi:MULTISPECIES: bifunctional 2-polyprenyl-6-hydroxyphenol methylase/3-demethylubiquinol 3-O-methyltransferase UbiG [unclassified Crossiella]|uniref:class I SAM-dependent methyltransferase n=1 Tax=unclassified Crossiella TaxID=2620835 RepID=UPI001FFE816F|nr:MULTISPECIES: class I SAM-dependent methyltransferase [unclassified Crossiella]MCK2243144.1 methyltransferase domain-containing protein [Crossiella sp. S99.2]MCK2257021.1 methyltransferase domain-containing protein [Crossiella sp. S99.1]
MSGYTDSALGKDSPTEHGRLTSIQNAADAGTIAVIEALAPQPDWDCLDLGAGAGSIARWLTQRCPLGRVLANDIDTRHLTDLGAAAQEADLTDPAYAPGRFDLVHARYVLCHLPERDEIVRRAASWLKPGGWLVVTDPYQLPAETSPFPVVRRIMAAYEQVYAGHGADLHWARGLPALLARSGLGEIGYTGTLGRMGNLDQDRWRPLVAQVKPKMLADGLIQQSEMDEFERLLNSSTFIDIPQFTISAWGRALG